MYVANDPERLGLFKEKGYSIICTDTENSVSIYETTIKKPLLMIVGGEKRGISGAVMALADKVVRLDYGREFPSALSAASASSILAFEVYRQTRG